jgi:hypothetical protein
MSNGGSDPYRIVECGYDKVNRSLYVFNEINIPGRTDNTDTTYDYLAAMFKQINKKNKLTNVDGAVGNTGIALYNRGCNVRLLGYKNGNNIMGAPKQQIMQGVAWLQQLNAIYIDKNRCPLTYKELEDYSFKVDDSTGEIMNVLEENQKDHSIDSIRYAMYDEILRG